MPLSRLTFENPWIAAVDAARRPANSLVTLGVGVAAVAAAVIGGRAAAESLAPMTAGGSALQSAVATTALFYLCIYLPLWLTAALAGRIEGRTVWRSEPRAALWAMAGVLIGAGGFGVAVGLAAATGVLGPAPEPVATAVGGVLAGMLLVAFQAGAEEIFFRGWMQPTLCARFGPWVGLIVTAALFAGLHVVGGARSPLSILNLMLGGLLFGLLALRTGGLWAAFLAHWGWNWTESSVLGLDPNPGAVATTSLMDLDLSGPALWSGGEDGMNGSLAATLVLLAMVAGLAMLRPRRS